MSFAKIFFLNSIKDPSENLLLSEVSEQIKDELNVKTVEVLEDTSTVVSFEVKPNLKILGPKYGKEVSLLREKLAKLDPGEIHNILSSGKPVIIDRYELDATEIILTTVEMKGYTVASEDGYTIAIPTEITDSLRLEGIARELVHRIQNMRREAGFEISDNINVFYEADSAFGTVFSQHGEYIKIETLASNLEPIEPTTGSYVEDHEIEGHNIKIGVMLV